MFRKRNSLHQELARYWVTDYDWRRCEAALNALPQFMSEIDGLDIIHSNMPGTVPPEFDKSLQRGDPPASGLSADERRACEQLAFVHQKGVGYAAEMGTQPQTLCALADSPVGLAAFLLSHDARSYELISHVFVDGRRAGRTRDDVLDNVTLYRLTYTAISAARLYWEDKFGYFDAKGVTIPAAVSVLPDELYQAPHSWAEQAYPNLVHYNELDSGGHFAVWEQPQLFSEEVRARFRSLRKLVEQGSVRRYPCEGPSGASPEGPSHVGIEHPTEGVQVAGWPATWTSGIRPGRTGRAS